ncbi:MAG: hypothetical protein WA655_09230 [Candidatus Korobacteraceae bacterium]
MKISYLEVFGEAMILTTKTASENRARGAFWIVLACLACLALIASVGCSPAGTAAQPTSVTFSTPYQTVVLINNSVYYGKLTGWGTPNPVLTDVFYIMSKTDPDTKQVSNILIKRGKELHGPDRMYLNPNQIIFVEPVGTDSKVAQLISEANKQH